ncbi:ribosomal protein S5 domain 2-like protein, partial [Ramicandelaber brevisporus]
SSNSSSFVIEMTLLPAPIYERVLPTEFYDRFVSSSGIRPDGRSPTEFRPTSIKRSNNSNSSNSNESSSVISNTLGSAVIRLGGTTVMCGIKGEAAEPRVGQPNRGYLVPNVEMNATCSASFKGGPPSETAQVVSQYISQILSDEETGPLVIESGKIVWCLYIDIVVVAYDGNVLDAALLAALAALADVRLPPATIDEKLGATVCDYDTPISGRKPLFTKQNGQEFAFPSTFVITGDGTRVAADPTEKEENGTIADGYYTVLVTPSGQIHGTWLRCSSRTSLPFSTMKDLYSQAVNRAKSLASLMN